MRGISHKELLEIDPWQYDNQQDLLNHIIEQCKQLNPWLPIDEFLKSGFEGLCWIVITGKVFECHFLEGKFYFGEKEVGRVIVGNITHVQPIHKPEPPI